VLNKDKSQKKEKKKMRLTDTDFEAIKLSRCRGGAGGKK